MNIRSIDLQVAIPRATDASKAQQVAEQQIVAQQQQLSDDSQRLALKRQQQVQSKPKSEGVRVEEKMQGEDNRHSGKNNEHNKDQDESDGDKIIAIDPLLGHHIDIKT